MAGAPPGNQNYRQGRIWKDAILRALEKRSRAEQVDAIEELAEKLLDAARTGDMTALKEVGDRIEGKALQAVGIGQDPNAAPVEVVHRVAFGRADTPVPPEA